MKDRSSQPTVAILADMPMGRLVPDEFKKHDRSITPWIYALFHDLEHQKLFNIHWITLKKYVSSYTVRQLQGQTIHMLPDPSLALGLLTGHFIAIRRIRSLLCSLKPAIVHAWGIELSYAKACLNQQCSRLLSYQGSLYAYCQRNNMSFLPRLQAFWEKRTTPSYNHVTCESPWAAECVRKINPDAHIYLIDYGVEDEFKETERTPSLRPSCVFAGTLTERKGFHFLIEAFKHPSLAHIDLYIAGNGDLRTMLNADISPNIHWLGSLSRQQLREQLETAWCLVLPTLADTGPTIVKEARYMGLPVITTTEAGSKQYIDQGKSGYIIPTKDSEALRKAILAVTESLNKSLAMGKHDLQKIREALSIRATSQKFMEVYKMMLKEQQTKNFF